MSWTNHHKGTKQKVPNKPRQTKINKKSRDHTSSKLTVKRLLIQRKIENANTKERIRFASISIPRTSCKQVFHHLVRRIHHHQTVWRIPILLDQYDSSLELKSLQDTYFTRKATGAPLSAEHLDDDVAFRNRLATFPAFGQVSIVEAIVAPCVVVACMI